MKLLEYMAMKRAVVAPRLENIQDLITDGTNGVLFTAGNSRELQMTLKRLAKNVSFRDTLGQNARLQVERERTWRRNAEKVISLVFGGGEC
jgi:glycosyltransferase involved in cell wall biosynthesis